MRPATRQEAGILRLRETGMTYGQIAERAKCSKGVVAGTLSRFRAGQLTMPVVARDKGGCRWVHGDPRREWRWCGSPVAGEGAWCAEHRSVVYRPFRIF